MKILFNKEILKHNPNSQGEGQYRIKKIAEQIKNTKINKIETDMEKYINLIHPKKHIKRIKNACNCKGILAETNLSPESYKAACISVELTILASKQNDFAIVRPPGHHAKNNKEAGFCFFNNIAIVTQNFVNKGKKVFILDIDGHHGDGTQAIFYNTNKVLFCSIHQKDTYPWSGTSQEKGKKEGLGYNLNIPLSAGNGDKEFLFAVETAIKRAKEFNPDIVGVSAGFDGYYKDKILDLKYTLNSYNQCAKKLNKNFKNIFAVLEGGYHEDVKECIEAFVNGIND